MNVLKRVIHFVLISSAISKIEAKLHGVHDGRLRTASIAAAFTTNRASRAAKRSFTPNYDVSPTITNVFGTLLEKETCNGQQSGILTSRPHRSNTSSLSLNLFLSKGSDMDGGSENSDELDPPPKKSDVNGEKADERKSRMGRVKKLAKKMLVKPLQLVPMPQAIAAVLKDATYAAVEEVEDIITKNAGDNVLALEKSKEMVSALVEEAFKPVELTLLELEQTLAKTRAALEDAKLQSMDAIEAIQIAAIAQAEGAATAVAQAEKVAELQVMRDIYSSAMSDADVSKLEFDDVDYDSSEMAPPFLDEDSCLVPGEPVVRVEKAPENSRRIFAGIDIPASVDDVWKVSWQTSVR